MLAMLFNQAALALGTDEFNFAEPWFETIDSNGVFPGNIITDLVQDRQGFLWIGTQSGLFRYDGYRFHKFSHDAANPTSLAEDYITCLTSTPSGKIIVGTSSKGLSELDPASGTFQNYRVDGQHSGGTIQAKIRALAVNSHGDWWVGTDNGLFYKTHDKQKLIRLQLHPGAQSRLEDNVIRALLLDQQGRLWVGSGNGLNRLKLDGKTFEQIGKIASDTLAGQEIASLFQAKDGKIWIGTNKNGAAWLMPDNLQLHHLAVDPTQSNKLSYGWVSAIAQPRPDQIWLSTFGGGINVVSATDGRVLRQIKHQNQVRNGLASDTSRTMLVDHAGLLWIGTWGGGLQRYHPLGQAFHLIQHDLTNPASLSHSDIRAILELSNGQILVGTAGNGIDILDRRLGLVGGYRAGSGMALPDANITSMTQTPDATIWIGTNQFGVLFLKPGSRQWEFAANLKEFQGTTILGTLTSRSKKVWMSTTTGLYQWDKALQRFERSKTPIKGSIFSLAEDKQGRLWIGTDQGLWRWKEASQELRQFSFDPGQTSSLSSNRVNDLLIDKQQQLWIETDQGLDRLRNLNDNSGEFEHISALIGRPGKPFGPNLMEDKLGRIWNGSFMLDPKRMRAYELSKADGMDIGGNWYQAVYKTHDGKLLYGGTQGLVVIEAEQFQPWQYQAPVRATELKINGRAQALGLLQPKLTLSSEQRSFTLEFAALDYSEPQKNRYRYRLQNYEQDWIDTDAQHRNASYGNLWPGDYLLRVQGSNRVGDWSGDELVVPIRILPAFWQTIWFLILVLLSLTGCAFALYRWRLRRLHAEAVHLKILIDERTTDLTQANNKLAASHDKLTKAHSHLQETQSQLIQSEKMAGLGTLTAGIAHEINNPTNFTHVAAQIQRTDIAEFEQFVMTLLDSGEAPEVIAAFEQRFEKLNQNVTTMLDGTERIIAIVKDLRAFTRLDEAEKKSVSLSECLNSTLNLVRSSWLEKVEFITDFSPTPELECWPALLNQVFMNLLVNACQAIVEKQDRGQGPIPGKLWLRLKLAADGNHIQVIFEDSGIGIEPAVQDHIMEPFYTTKEVGSGTGLGLSSAFGIVQKHGGSLTFVSTPGVGSQFTVSLKTHN